MRSRGAHLSGREAKRKRRERRFEVAARRSVEQHVGVGNQHLSPAGFTPRDSPGGGQAFRWRVHIWGFAQRARRLRYCFEFFNMPFSPLFAVPARSPFKDAKSLRTVQYYYCLRLLLQLVAPKKLQHTDTNMQPPLTVALAEMPPWPFRRLRQRPR